MQKTKKSLMTKIFIKFISIYRYCISPILGDCCRFYPSCSCYTQEAIAKYGAIKGTWLGIKRISRCHPFHAGGIDLVPEPENKKTEPYNINLNK